MNKELANTMMILGGIAIGFLTGTLCVKRAKAELRKEIIDSESKRIKREIMDEIKEDVEIKDIVRDVKKSIEKDLNKSVSEGVINDLKKEFRQASQTMTEEVEKCLKMTKDIHDFEDRIGRVVGIGVRNAIGAFEGGK